MIDAGDDHVGEVVEHAGDRQVYAVGRRAIDMIETVGRARSESGRSSVSELLAPLRSRSGATTVTSPSVPSASASAEIPGAK
jgi:hypothetical protein